MKKRHHYISKFYLDGFIDPHCKPHIWVYEKGNPNVIKTTSTNIAVKKHYYSFTTPEGEKDSETFEDAFAEIEGIVAPIFRKIESHDILDDEERYLFALFLSLMIIRVPNFRKKVEKAAAEIIKKSSMVLASNKEVFKSSIERMGKDTGKTIHIPIEDVRKFALSGEYDIEVNPMLSLKMFQVAFRLAPILYDMNWAFVRATNNYKFVTSDNPVFYFDPTSDPRLPYGMGLLNENIEVTFPISKDLMFLGTWKGNEGYKQGNNTVRVFTRRTVLSASRFIYSSRNSDGLIALVQEYKNFHYGIRIA